MLGSQLGAQPTLESNQWFGAQGNRLWVGLVEGDGNLLVSGEELIDRNGSNRVKVRIMGYHTRSRTKLPPKDLPWASVMIPATETVTTTNAGITHGLAIGSWVLGTFMDGESAQSPLVLGTLGLVDSGAVPDGFYEDIAATGTGSDNTNGSVTGVFNQNEGGGDQRDSSNQSSSGAANLLGERGNNNNGDNNALNLRKRTLAVTNAKCGNRAESEFGRILQDLFKFVNANDKVGNILVDKLTGNITQTASIISNYGGRLINATNNLLGGIKALVVREVKKFLQDSFSALIVAIQLPNGRGLTSSKGIKNVKQFVLEAIKCLFRAVIEQVGTLIIDIVTKLIDQVLNTAFCQISNILKGIVKTIQTGINSGLKAISSITGNISKYGNFGGSFLQKIGKLIEQFCDGQLSCSIGISSVTTGVGEKPDNSVYDFFDRLELFGGLPNDVNVGLYGSDSFLQSIENIELRDSDGNIVTGTLDCNKVTQFQWPMIPNIFFTGTVSKLNQYTFDTDIGNKYGERNPVREEFGTPVTVRGRPVGIGGRGGTPISHIDGKRITVGGTGGTPVSYGGSGGVPLIVDETQIPPPGDDGPNPGDDGPNPGNDGPNPGNDGPNADGTQSSPPGDDGSNPGGVPISINNVPVLIGSTGGLPVTVRGVAVKVGATGGLPVKIGTSDGIPVLIGEQVRRTDDQIFNDNPFPQANIDGRNPNPTGIPAINSKGELVSVKVTNPGFGLTTPPKINIFPINDWGFGGRGFAILNGNGGVKCVVITSQGGGYPYFDVSVSTSNFVKLLPNGQPDYAKIAGIYTENPFWLGVLTKGCPPVVEATGSDYNETTQVIVEPGQDEVNEIVLPELKPILDTGRLIGIEVVKEGFGFTTLPKVYLRSKNGNFINDRTAVIRPVVEYVPRENAKDILSSYEEFREIIDCVGHPGD